jgi:ribosome-associated toxin RatA of RatAB toxin-antitoxin module
MTKYFLRPLFALWVAASVAAFLLASTTAHAADSSTPPQIDVFTRSVDGHPSFDVSGSMTVAASLERSWGVLTNYDRHAEFVPNLSDSHVLSRDADTCVVVQHGFARFLFIRQPVEMKLRITEHPMQSIDIHLISGNMHHYQARWEVQASADGGTRISYGGVISPDFYVPGLFGPSLIKSDLRGMLEAVRTEIEKKQ